MMQDVHVKLNPSLPWKKQHSTGKDVFTSKMNLNLRRKLVKCYIWSIVLYVAETWTLGKQIGNAWKVLKCGAEKNGEDQCEK
jgi:hypothetical protein